MHLPTADLRIRATKPLIAPAVLEEEIPPDDASATLVARTRREGAPAEMGTTGNAHAHLVLHGGSNGPNYAATDIRAAAVRMRRDLSRKTS